MICKALPLYDLQAVQCLLLQDNDANIEFVEEADRLCGKSCTYSREFYHDLVTCLCRHNEVRTNAFRSAPAIIIDAC